MSRLEGKVAIVTGAASGIGEGTARRFAEEGARLVICDVQGDKLEDVAASINDARGEKVCAAVAADVSKASDVEGVCQQAAERFGGLDIMYNNAGIGRREGNVRD